MESGGVLLEVSINFTQTQNAAAKLAMAPALLIPKMNDSDRAM
jgi:hypothetical protein